jgi:hypothetical protein
MPTKIVANSMFGEAQVRKLDRTAVLLFSGMNSPRRLDLEDLRRNRPPGQGRQPRRRRCV